MKRLLFLGLGSALMFTMGGVGPAQADNGPHVSTAVAAGVKATLGQAGGGRCASCHRAHTAKAEMLLKAAQPALCFSCHAAGLGAATDVVNGIDHYSARGLRGGGFDYALIDGAGANKTMGLTPGAHGLPTVSQMVPVLAVGGPTVPGTAVTSKHQIDGTTTGTMWGNGAISATVNTGKAGVKLECGSCHDPHGNGNYRILKPVPVDSGSTVGVNIPDAGAKVYTTFNYWDVRDLNVPGVAVAGTTVLTDGYIANVAQWCTTCHTRYLAGSGSYKTNSGDAVFTYKHRSDRVDKGGASRPNCIQCHVSHGSNVAMTGTTNAEFTAPDGSVPAATANSRLLRVNNRGTCVMCHNV